MRGKLIVATNYEWAKMHLPDWFTYEGEQIVYMIITSIVATAAPSPISRRRVSFVQFNPTISVVRRSSSPARPATVSTVSQFTSDLSPSTLHFRQASAMPTSSSSPVTNSPRLCYPHHRTYASIAGSSSSSSPYVGCRFKSSQLDLSSATTGVSLNSLSWFSDDTLLAKVDQELMMQEVTREGVSQTNRSDDSREGMNIHQVETSSEKDKTKNLSWTQDMDNCLIDVLVVQGQLGLKVDKAFKGPAYTAACKEMNDKFQINCTTQHIKNRLKAIKKNFATLRELMRNGSGFSWNDMSKTFDAEPAVWRTYIDAHPYAKQFRYKPIHNYDKLLIVCGTDQAIGVGAFTPKETSRSFREEEARKLDNVEDFVSLDKKVEGETGDDLADTCTQPVPSSRTTSSSGLKRNNKRTPSSDVIVEKIKELGNKIEKLSESFDKSNINYDQLYEEIMKIEGVDHSFLMRAFDYVAENVMRVKVFLAYPPEERLEWLNMRMGH
ncbi:hypothetical protein HHK36_010765 [Tetracentron sinense]|uniref:Myb/SANT-like domain-containing protein n=1 Tax=Tetracentron sinense TaxID=13715 RepID=A0A835DGQ9_TETSI|nr:hypothetical protein HHK36_010765 [Tetracentron sinense]